jgi:nucleotide-binding universal stress UspA family protein
MRIVVGYDGSEAAKHALDRVTTYGSGDDEVTVVTVAELQARAGVTEGAHLDPSELPRRQQSLDEAKAALAERGLQADAVVGQGDPGDAIVQVANERNADVIIVGHRGLNPFERLLLGSVSSKVVHRAACDVIVVR